MTIALVMALGCESDAHRLQRLHDQRATACLPVYQADSVRARRALARARVTSPAHSVDEADADVAELRRELAELQRHAALTPTQRKAEDDSATAARASCQLAERDLNRFMAGR